MKNKLRRFCGRNDLSESHPPEIQYLGLCVSTAGSNLRGKAPRGAGRGPGDQRWDLSLFKNIRVTESTKLQFRAEAINVFNHTNFNSVSTSRTSLSFGQVLSSRDARIMQLALKLNF